MSAETADFALWIIGRGELACTGPTYGPARLEWTEYGPEHDPEHRTYVHCHDCGGAIGNATTSTRVALMWSQHHQTNHHGLAVRS